MKKIKEIVVTVWKAVRYSFAFCLRNNRRDTIIVAILLLTQTLIAYGMILITGELISTIQAHLTNSKRSVLNPSDFMKWEYCFPITLFVSALFLEIVLQKYKSYVMSRQRHALRIANYIEMNNFKASLDIGRRRSQFFDDIEKKLEELPNGWLTRMEFTEEVMDFVGIFISFSIFGISLLTQHYWYVFILVISSIPMAFTEFTAVSRFWKMQLDFAPHNKKRSVLQGAYNRNVGFLQGVMFNQIPTLAKQIKENYNHVIKLSDEMRWNNLQISLGGYVFAMCGLTIVLVHCFYNTLITGGDIGALTVVMASSRQFQWSIRNIVTQVAGNWQSVKGTIMIEEEYFRMKPLLETPNPVKPEFAGTPTIRFTNVNFSYPDKNSLVLKGISFTIEPGSKTVIIGKNGSGKSSLIGLLLRHYDPTAGDIRVGDINLRNIKPSEWSKYACALLQDFIVFNRQVGAEIASSRLDQPIDMEQVRESAKFAGFDSVIESDPQGYNAQIGTEFGGREFSGGEEQRLALARAKYRNTPILILDEPDAKLDPEAANQLIENVFKLTGITVVIVTQHISRATKADKIIVLEDGEIVETGRHTELLALDGKYASMLTKDRERLGT